FVDGLERVVQTKRTGTIHTGPDTPAQDVMIVSGRSTYDAFGRAVEQRYPLTEPLGTPGVYNPTVDGGDPTRVSYDVLDRPTRVTEPDSTVTATAYGFGADRDGRTQFETTVTDANGVQAKTYQNVRDLITGVRELNLGGAQTVWTSYVYDALD